MYVRTYSTGHTVHIIYLFVSVQHWIFRVGEVQLHPFSYFLCLSLRGGFKANEKSNPGHPINLTLPDLPHDTDLHLSIGQILLFIQVYSIYRIAGKFGEIFNFTIWRFYRKSPNLKSAIFYSDDMYTY